MMYKDLVKDYVERTLVNLQVIEDIASGKAHLLYEGETVSSAQTYEVTQLINSMLGLIVLPQQRFFNNIPQIPLNELTDWPSPLITGKFPNDLNNLRDLMRYLRNSVAHFNIEFLPGSNGEISGIKIWNNRDNARNWEAEMKLKDLRLAVQRFLELMLPERV